MYHVPYTLPLYHLLVLIMYSERLSLIFWSCLAHLMKTYTDRKYFKGALALRKWCAQNAVKTLVNLIKKILTVSSRSCSLYNLPIYICTYVHTCVWNVMSCKFHFSNNVVCKLVSSTYVPADVVTLASLDLMTPSLVSTSMKTVWYCYAMYFWSNNSNKHLKLMVMA